MDKNKKDLTIVALTLVAQNVYELEKTSGVCSIRTDRRYYGDRWVEEPSVHLLDNAFLEYFGDTEFEYVEDKDGDKQMQTRVNGVLFYALVN